MVATVLVGAECSPMEDCHIKLVDELFAVEKNIKLTERTEDMERLVAQGSPSKSKLLLFVTTLFLPFEMFHFHYKICS